MKVLITGGGGFLGGAILQRLLERGDDVRSFSRGHYPELRDMGVEVCRGDLVDGEAVAAAMDGCDAVFHVAASPLIWAPFKESYRTNVTGTENVISACRRHGVRRLIFTSSPSVVFDGKSHDGMNEQAPYPAHYLSPYPKTKALAEQLVRQANDADLATVSLRPHLIWGPKDNHLVPTIISQGRAGKLRLLEDGRQLVDSVYIDNAADAHLLAADRLSPGSPVAGNVYFITNGEPMPVKNLINNILAAAGLPPVTKNVSSTRAYVMGAILEVVYTVARLKGEPAMTRFLARQLSTAHWFNISAARRDLGYEPKVSVEEGLTRLKDYLSRPSDDA